MMPYPEFLSVYAVKTKSCKRLDPPASFLVIKNRGEGTIEITNDQSNESFLLKASDPFLYLFSIREFIGQLCFKNVEGDTKNRLDIIALR